MSRGTGQAVTFVAATKRSVGEVRIERWETAARLRRAMKRWAVLSLLAVLSILIPVAHFLLVPGFLIAAPISAAMLLRQKSGITCGEGTCPSCGGQLIIEARADSWPFYERCQLCHAEVRVEKIVASTRGVELTPAS
jgi:hypothetical protein